MVEAPGSTVAGPASDLQPPQAASTPSTSSASNTMNAPSSMLVPANPDPSVALERSESQGPPQSATQLQLQLAQQMLAYATHQASLLQQALTFILPVSQGKIQDKVKELLSGNDAKECLSSLTAAGLPEASAQRVCLEYWSVHGRGAPLEGLKVQQFWQSSRETTDYSRPITLQDLTKHLDLSECLKQVSQHFSTMPQQTLELASTLCLGEVDATLQLLREVAAAAGQQQQGNATATAAALGASLGLGLPQLAGGLQLALQPQLALTSAQPGATATLGASAEAAQPQLQACAAKAKGLPSATADASTSATASQVKGKASAAPAAGAKGPSNVPVGQPAATATLVAPTSSVVGGHPAQLLMTQAGLPPLSLDGMESCTGSLVLTLTTDDASGLASMGAAGAHQGMAPGTFPQSMLQGSIPQIIIPVTPQLTSQLLSLANGAGMNVGAANAGAAGTAAAGAAAAAVAAVQANTPAVAAGDKGKGSTKSASAQTTLSAGAATSSTATATAPQPSSVGTGQSQQQQSGSSSSAASNSTADGASTSAAAVPTPGSPGDSTSAPGAAPANGTNPPSSVIQLGALVPPSLNLASLPGLGNVPATQLDAFSSLVAQSNAAISCYLQERQQLVKEINTLKKHKEWADSRIASLIRKAFESDKPLAEEAKQLKQDLASVKAERDTLATRCSEFEGSVCKLKDSTYREAGLRREYEHRMQAAEAELRGSQLREQELQKQMEELQAEIKALQKKIAAAEKARQKAVAEKTAAADKAAELAKISDTQASALKTAERLAAERLEGVEVEARGKAELRRELERQQAAWEAQRALLQAEAASAREEAEVRGAAVARLQEQLAGQGAEVAARREELALAVSRAEYLERENGRLVKELRAAEARVLQAQQEQHNSGDQQRIFMNNHWSAPDFLGLSTTATARSPLLAAGLMGGLGGGGLGGLTGMGSTAATAAGPNGPSVTNGSGQHGSIPGGPPGPGGMGMNQQAQQPGQQAASSQLLQPLGSGQLLGPGAVAKGPGHGPAGSSGLLSQASGGGLDSFLLNPASISFDLVPGSVGFQSAGLGPAAAGHLASLSAAAQLWR